MTRTVVVGVLAVPVVAFGIFWLTTNGHFVPAAALLAAGVLALLVGAVVAIRRGHRRWSALLVAGALVVAGAVGWYGWSLNSKLDGIQRTDDSVLKKGDRPPRTAGQEKGALNILLMGADNPSRQVEKPTVAELLADGEWNPGAYRSDTLMLVHIPADRSAAYAVSIPRDTYARIYDEEGQAHERAKVNAAFSSYGPYGTWRTVENLSGLRLDHMSIVDFEGFRALTSAIGGVDVYVAESFRDPQQNVTWDEGKVHLEGERALQYVRTRYGLDEGDFDRVARQQNFLRAVLEKMVSDENVGNPVAFSNTVEALTEHLTVDASWSSSDLRGLAASLRGLDSQNVRFLTLPLDRYASVEGVGSVNIVDEGRARELWTALGRGRIDDYLRKYPEDGLADPRNVD